MDYDRIVRDVVAGLLNPLRERRDYGGNQLEKGGDGDCSGEADCQCQQCRRGRD